ncbi:MULTISPECIES: hypothetical protein [unclassified Microbulbifer]|uniref:hypothetical protein n=1 Tax=unclassified Microbulbifer TaxID=2619833 RepID=UPI0027E3C3A6|nr:MULTISPECIES: hypothetical protein [unclassified Microbulbifer]
MKKVITYTDHSCLSVFGVSQNRFVLADSESINPDSGNAISIKRSRFTPRLERLVISTDTINPANTLINECIVCPSSGVILKPQMFRANLSLSKTSA